MTKDELEKIRNKVKASKAFVPKDDKPYLKVWEKTCQKCDKMFSAGRDNQTLCFDCWKKQQDELKENKEDKRQDDIRWGQSFNLAVNLVCRWFDGEENETQIKEAITRWQKWFYEELKKGEK